MQNPWWQADGQDTELMQLWKIQNEGGGLNPVQKTKFEQLLQQAGLAPGSSPSNSMPLDATGQYIADTVGKLDEKYFAKIKEFNTNNPFKYDEVLAQEVTKAGTRLDPYYKQTLDDYTKGINLQKSRSLEDRDRTLSNLNADLDTYKEETKNNLMDALEKSRQGYADVGNYFSGAQAKTTAKVGLASGDALDKYTKGKEESMNTAKLTDTRNQQDSTLKQTMFERGVGKYNPDGTFTRGADSEAQVRSQAIGEVGVRQQQRQFELGAYAGPPPGADQNAYYLNLYSGLTG